MDEIAKRDNPAVVPEIVMMAGALAYWLFWFFLAFKFSIFVMLVPFVLSVFNWLAKDYHPMRYR